ncbi:hypothetical protein XAB3213_2330014 [Xanthomonas citri pv. bilvae]|nr:hypothetical protein XAB3213_2330014 [Xanthomonas citri pv. bilvae]
MPRRAPVQQYHVLAGRRPAADACANHRREAAAKKKPPGGGFLGSCTRRKGLALTRLETRVRLADHEDLPAAADHLAVAVTGLRRLQGGQDFHGTPRRKRLDSMEECPQSRVHPELSQQF